MADFTTDAYLNPLINQVYETQTTTLMSDTDSSFDDWVFDVPGVPPGTTSLQNWQAPTMALPGGGTTNGPLAGLVTPEIVEWKQVGQPDSYYVEAGRTGKLPNTSPAAPSPPFCMQWEWRGMIIWITPLLYTLDIRVRGEFSPPTLVKDTDQLIVHPRMGNAVAFGTAALIGVERNNQTWQTKYDALATSNLEDIANNLVKAESGTTMRIGRLSSRGLGGRGRGLL